MTQEHSAQGGGTMTDTKQMTQAEIDKITAIGALLRVVAAQVVDIMDRIDTGSVWSGPWRKLGDARIALDEARSHALDAAYQTAGDDRSKAFAGVGVDPLDALPDGMLR